VTYQIKDCFAIQLLGATVVILCLLNTLISNYFTVVCSGIRMADTSFYLIIVSLVLIQSSGASILHVKLAVTLSRQSLGILVIVMVNI
jgi:hypothetical protein